MGDKSINWSAVALGLIAALAVAVAVWLWLHPRTNSITTTQYQQVPVEKRVETIRTVTVPGPTRIVTIEKQAVAEKLQLPPEVKDDPDQEIVADAEIPPSEGGTSTVVVMDKGSQGEPATFRVIAKEIPPPFFALENHGQAGGWYGYDQHLQGVVQGEAQWSFLRVMHAHLALKVQGASGAGGIFAGAGMLYQW